MSNPGRTRGTYLFHCGWFVQLSRDTTGGTKKESSSTLGVGRTLVAGFYLTAQACSSGARIFSSKSSNCDIRIESPPAVGETGGGLAGGGGAGGIRTIFAGQPVQGNVTGSDIRPPTGPKNVRTESSVNGDLC